MRLWYPRVPALAAFAVLLILSARVAWHASHTKVGWELIRHDWAGTLAAIVGIDRPYLCDREPEEQSRFWLKEIERLGVETGPPCAAAGAAWMLDVPAAGFVQRHFRANKAAQGIPGLPLGAQIELDHEAITGVVDKFEDVCHERCIGLIDHATHVDRVNLDLWRARALLSFRHGFLGWELKPRRPNWQSILDECAQLDPENALYDYLAALYEWTNSADHRWEPAGQVLVVSDKESYERGNRRFAAGLEKPRLMFGINCGADTVAFLEDSALSQMDRLKAAESHGVQLNAANLLHGLLRWQIRQQSALRRNGKIMEAAATLRETMHVASQISATENPADLIVEPLILRHFALINLLDLSVASPDVVDSHEPQNIAADFRDVRLEMAINDKAFERLKAKDRPQRGLKNTGAAGLAVMAQPIAEILLLMGLCFTILARFCGIAPQVESVRMDLLTHVAAWVAGLGLSYVLLGMCPAGIVPADIQTWGVRGLLTVPFLFVFIGILAVFKRKFRVGYRQLMALSISFAIPWACVFYFAVICDWSIAIVSGSNLFAIMLFVVALLAAGWFAATADLAFLRRPDVTARDKAWLAFMLQILAAFTIPWGSRIAEFAEANLEIKVWVPSRAWSEAQSLGFTAEGLRSSMTLDQHHWLWSLMQWHAYCGLYVAITLSLLILTAWSALRLSRATEGGFRQILRSGKANYVRLMATTVARSLALVGMVALIIYVAAVPSAIEDGEGYYQRHYRRLVDPVGAHQEINAEVAVVRNDTALMAELRQKAEK